MRAATRHDRAMSRIFLVLTTFGSADEARRLARELVERGLAACAQVSAIDSVYRWQGALHEEPEWRLLLKTRAELAGPLMTAIRERHPYELPALCGWPAELADADFARWVDEQTGGAAGAG